MRAKTGEKVSKVRVHELAKQLGMESKVVLAKLQEMGEFVRSASSTVEAPVVRKLIEMYPDAKPAEEKKPVKKAAAKQAAAKPKSEVSAEQAAELAAELGVDINALKAQQERVEAAKAESAKTHAAEAIAEEKSELPKPAPRPGNNPFSTGGVVPRPPRPGNNPFSTGGTTPRPPQRPTGAPQRPTGAPQRPGMSGPRPGSVRPGFAARPPGSRPPAGTGFPPRTAAPSTGAPVSPYKSTPGGAPAGGPQRPGGGRPPQRGGAGGAFGKNASKKSGRKSKSRKALRDEFDNMQAPQLGGAVVPHGDGKTPIRMRRGASLADFADKINADPAALVAALFHLGEMVTATQSVDADTFEILGVQLGYDIQIVSPEDEDRELLQGFDIDLTDELSDIDADLLVARPPVVTVMGHVDHGKTSLLDAIRKSEVMKSEAGGITQHIGAYQIHHDHNGINRAITFIDTPGHAAFTKMRARGAGVTDIVVLVVAADDGVMPQTIEAINHARVADVPIVVALNKIDKQNADVQRVLAGLAEQQLTPEAWGGDTIVVEMSAQSGLGIDDLLEQLNVVAEIEELTANPTGRAKGVVLEAQLDIGRGPVATVLVDKGTLKVGDPIVAGAAWGKVRALINDRGEQVKEVGPSAPVQVLGLSAVPGAGEEFRSAPDERTARTVAGAREQRYRAMNQRGDARVQRGVKLEDIFTQIQAGEIATLNVIVKADVHGSLEAVTESLRKLERDDVRAAFVHRGVGTITENDISLAAATNATLIGFNVRPDRKIRELAEKENVEIRTYEIIYKLLEDIEKAMKGMLAPEFVEVVTGEAEVREIFKAPKVGAVAGCSVVSGVITRGSRVRFLREGTIIWKGNINTLRRFKDDVKEVREGFECGLSLTDFQDLKPGDTIETYDLKEVERV